MRRPSSEALSAPAAIARIAKSWPGRTSACPRLASSVCAASTKQRKPPSNSSARSAPERDMDPRLRCRLDNDNLVVYVQWATWLSNMEDVMTTTPEIASLPGITHYHVD